MNKRRKRQDPVRAPLQKRSQARVDHILETTKKLILDKGCGGLKITEIADEAQITVGSIYQYFPHKGAIIAELAERYLADNRAGVEMAMSEPPEDLDGLAEITDLLLEEYYKLHRGDPVLRDIWAGYATDKAIQHIDANDTQQNVDTIFKATSHLFDPKRSAEAKRMLFLILSFGGAAVTAAVNESDRKGRLMMNNALVLLHGAWDEGIKPLARR